MLCQNCKKNEANRTFIVNFPGGQHEVHICDECLTKMWNYASATGQKEAFAAIAGWWPGKEDPRGHGTSPFPQDAGTDMIAKRQMAALRARLDEAVERENYEEAAGLRDLIASMETGQEVLKHES